MNFMSIALRKLLEFVKIHHDKVKHLYPFLCLHFLFVCTIPVRVRVRVLGRTVLWTTGSCCRVALHERVELSSGCSKLSSTMIPVCVSGAVFA